MPIPRVQPLLLPVLLMMEDEAWHSSDTLRKGVRDIREFAISEEDAKQTHSKSRQNVLVNRVAWALSHLVAGGAITRKSKRESDYMIAPRGSEILKGNPTRLSIRDLRLTQSTDTLQVVSRADVNPLLAYSTSPHELILPSGRSVSIAGCFRRFDLWDAPIQDTYGGKAVLNSGGKPLFAELAILRLIQQSGWQGVWVDTYRRTFRQSMPPDSYTLPPDAEHFLEKANAGEKWRPGCFDVFAWTVERCLFVESKRRGHDAINAHQREWLELALDSGIPLESLVVFEWAFLEVTP